MQLDLDADETARAHEVLFSPGSLWPHHIWPFLDAPTKASLRLVSKTMRSQVDGLIQAVASPGSGSFSAADLTAALLQWPSIRQPTLLNMGSVVDLQPLATTGLTGLTSLEMRMNQTAITTAGAIPLLVQLLGQHSPITVQAAAKTLAELALSHAQNQATVAAAGAILPLVRLLGQHSSASVQVAAAGTLRVLTYTHAGNQSDITAAGAIAPLIQLLGQHSPADVQLTAANALAALALSHAENQAAIAAAGAIPAMVQLHGQHSSEDVQRAASYTLNILGFYTQQ
ncbi:hypothetical protein FOA52_004036 [Chlamydomonas sp. UWO 241]|nr:hypothetical protein FOA52_004036 [Chlamydomonas sp. UWO 241]